MGTLDEVTGQTLLRVDENKTERFSFLSNEIIKPVEDQSKELVVKLETEVLTAPQRMNANSLAPCRQEEADGRVFLHAAEVS